MSCLYSKQTLLGKDDDKKFEISNIILAKCRNNELNWLRSYNVINIWKISSWIFVPNYTPCDYLY